MKMYFLKYQLKRQGMFTKLFFNKQITPEPHVLKVHVSLLLYPAAKETRKFVSLKFIENKICWIQEIYVTCKTNCIVYT